jgi:hypothetical protein
MWQAPSRHHVFSVFHDGNAGHLWRGEVVSLMGEGIFGVGAIMWLMYLVGSPSAIVLAALALGLPYLLAGPLVVPLQNAKDPGRTLRWIGQIRALLALGLVPMHYHTILPVVYLLLFAVSLCGRLRVGARIAAVRVCLAPGELEHVSDDLHIGTVLATVLGPLLALVLFVALGDRILLVSVGAFIFFLINANSDGFLDPLPRTGRAFLLARPEADEYAARADQNEQNEEEEDADPEWLREELLPEWYQQGPQRIGQWAREARDGLALAGTSTRGLVAICILGLLALVGGGLSLIELYYLTTVLQQPIYYVAPLVAAEAGGAAFGLALIGSAGRRVAGPLLVVGVSGVGVALAGWALLPRLPLIFGVAFGLGAANAMAVSGARVLLGRDMGGRQRLAIATGEELVTSFCGLLGAPLFGLFYAGSALARPFARLARFFPGWPIVELLLGTGAGLIAAAVIAAVLLVRKPGGKARKRGQAGRGGAKRGRLPALGEEYGGWDDGASREWQSLDDASGEWDAADYHSDYGDDYGDSRQSRSMTGHGPATGYDSTYGPATGEYDDYGNTGYRQRAPRRPRR